MTGRTLVLCAALVVASGVTEARTQAVQLRFTPPVGQVTRYRTVNQVWSSGDTSAAPVLSTMYWTRTVMAMDGANYVVKTVTDSTATVMPGGGGGQPGRGGDPMRGMAITQHMDPRGHVLSSEVTPPPGLPPFVANMLQRNAGSTNNRSTAVMPEGAISPGYTWTDSMVTSASAGRGRSLQVVYIVTYKFERVEREGGARVAVISMNGTQQGGLTGTVTGEFALDLDGGRLAHMSTNMTVQPSEGGSPMQMKTTMETLP
jgi:hypothetical protein